MERLTCEYTFHLRGATAGNVSRQLRPSERMPVSCSQRAFSHPEIDSYSLPWKTPQQPVSLWQESDPKTELFCLLKKIFFFLIDLFLAVLGLCCCTGFSLVAWASRCLIAEQGLSSSRASVVACPRHRISSCGTWT